MDTESLKEECKRIVADSQGADEAYKQAKEELTRGALECLREVFSWLEVRSDKGPIRPSFSLDTASDTISLKAAGRSYLHVVVWLGKNSKGKEYRLYIEGDFTPCGDVLRGEFSNLQDLCVAIAKASVVFAAGI